MESGIDILAFSLAGVGENHDTRRQGTSYQKVLETIRSLQACKQRLGKITPRVHIAYMLLRSGLTDLERLPGETHNAWRQGTDYHQVLEAIRSLQDCKRRLGKVNPRVHIAYMLLRSGLKDLDKLPQELKGLGIRQVVISTLDLVAAPELEKESLAGVSETEAIDISQRLVEVADVGAKNDLTIYYPDLLAHNQRRECHENVLGAAVVSMDGDISPCVFTNIPTLAGNYYVRGEAHKIQSRFFGNVRDLSLPEIWRQPDYVSFRRSWKRKNFPHYCRNCLKLK